jgi:lipid-binding SYLF domain-containing protein
LLFVACSTLTSGAGLSVGSGPSVVVVDAGMAVYAFIFGQQGLMAGVGLQGQRIVRFDEWFGVSKVQPPARFA